MIYSTLPNGNSGLVVEDEQLAWFQGRTAPSNDSASAHLCTKVRVDSIFYVQDFPVQ